MNANITKPLNRSILWLWQVAWVLLAVLALSRFAVGAAVYYQGIHEMCNKGIEECHKDSRLTPEDVASLTASGINPREYAVYTIALNIVLVLAFTVVGVLIFAQKKDDISVGVMALSLLVFGSSFGFNGLLYQEYSQLRVLWFILQNLSWSLLPIFFYTFPNGRIVPRYIWLFLPVWIFYWILGTYFPGINKDSLGYQIFSNFVWLFMWGSMAAAQAYRYKKVSNLEERRQSKWVVAGVIMVVVFVVIFAGFFSNFDLFANKTPYTARQMVISSLFTLSVMSTIPISIGIAILRSRLWDIDLIIRKTLVYSLLTGLLGLVYFGGVALLQGILTADRRLPTAGDQAVSSPPSAVVIVVTTLVIAALANPLRRRLQETIDRRFYRQKYDAEKALADFAAAARSQADLLSLTTSLVSVVQDTIQPEEVKLWLKPTRNL